MFAAHSGVWVGLEHLLVKYIAPTPEYIYPALLKPVVDEALLSYLVIQPELKNAARQIPVLASDWELEASKLTTALSIGFRCTWCDLRKVVQSQ